MSGSKSDSKLFSRNKASELKEELHKALSGRDKNNVGVKEFLKKVVANMTMNNNEMVSLASDVIALMKINDPEAKKMCFLYIVHYARSIPGIAAEAKPYLFEKSATSDLESENPLVRSLALKSVSYIKDYCADSIPYVRRSLRDDNPYVRKTAAFCVAKLYDHDRQLVEDSDLIESLNRMLTDENPTVVSSALASLVDIWQRSESIKLNIDYGNASNIVQILPDCSEWGQTYILEALMSYVPQATSDAELIAERILPRLSHSNSAVVLACIRLLLYLFNYISDTKIVDSLCQRMSPPLVTLLAKGPEIQYLALRNALLIIQRRPQILQNDVRVFFCNYNDPIYVKVTKLELMFMLANEKNIGVVLAELKEYATEIDVHFVRKSVRAIGKLAIKIESAAKLCVDLLMELVATKITYIVQEATVVIRNIFRKYPNRFEAFIPQLCEHIDDLDEPESKAAMVWILGEYADRIENSDSLIDDFLFSFKEETYEVQLALLTATVKLFIQRPTKGSELVPKVLKWATEESDHPDLRERGFFYWRLLSNSQPGIPKQIVMGAKPSIVAESEKLDPVTLEEMCLNVGTLATVYLKPIKSVFRSARSRRLEDSPALQKKHLPAQILAGSSWGTNTAPLSGVPISADKSSQPNLAAAVDAADEYFSSLGSQRMANLQVTDDNLDGMSAGVSHQGGMIVNQYPNMPQVPGGPNAADLLL